MLQGCGGRSGSVGLGENESLEGLSLETLHALPVVSPDAEGVDFVDPVFRVVVFVIFAGDGFVSREAVGALMLVC